MSDNNYLEQKVYSATAVPLYRWRGANPWLFDLTNCQQGWLTCLHLTREGDSTLLPLAWDQHDATGDDYRTLAPLQNIHSDQHSFPYPITSMQTIALQSEAVTMTMREMEQDGWQLNGRFDIYFTGTDTDPNFQQHIQQILWHAPQSTDKKPES